VATDDAAEPSAAGPDETTLAALAAALFAIDPPGLGGVWLRAGGGPTRDAWLAGLRRLLPEAVPWRRLPLRIDDDRLLGGLDLGATLRSGRPVAQPGMLAEAHGGVVLLAMAERLDAGVAARLAAVLDAGELRLQRDGLEATRPARLGVVALDEGQGDELPPAALLDRLGLAPLLDPGLRPEAIDTPLSLWTRDEIDAARQRVAQVAADASTLQALCAAALTLGVASLRAPLFALRAARAAAALDGRDRVSADDAALAARLVLAPRATRLPPADAEEAPEPEAPPPAEPPDDPGPPDAGRDPAEQGTLDDVVLEAARASIPAGLLAALLGGTPLRGSGAGRAGALRKTLSRGRPLGARRGDPRGGARLDLLQTLRAAAPWQALRPARHRDGGPAGPRIAVRREDFHVKRYAQRSPTCTLFVVDASGSAALHRLAEAKGAVELLLAECYVRRDSVAVLGFRGRGAELLLPPTRSLVRAKRSLAGLPGGGGTPLASGLVGALELAGAVRRHGDTPVVVLLTDGRANIALDGSPGRERAHADALAAARRFGSAGVQAVLIDTAAQPQAVAREIALAMGARYLPLPHAGAAAVSQAVRVASGG